MPVASKSTLVDRALNEITKHVYRTHDLLEAIEEHKARTGGQERAEDRELYETAYRIRVGRGYDGEICQECNRPLGYFWNAPDWLWERIMGGPGGVLCATCFASRVASYVKQERTEIALRAQREITKQVVKRESAETQFERCQEALRETEVRVKELEAGLRELLNFATRLDRRLWEAETEGYRYKEADELGQARSLLAQSSPNTPETE